MKKQRILNVLGQVDEEYIQEAAPGERQARKKNPRWVKWAAAAACLCLIVAGMIGAIDGVRQRVPQEERPSPGISQGFRLKDAEDRVLYSPIAVGDATRYRLLTDNASIYRPTEQDLGAFMGTVGSSEDTSLVGCSVYHLRRHLRPGEGRAVQYLCGRGGARQAGLR